MKKIAILFIILILIVSFAFIIHLSKKNNTFVNKTISEVEKVETPIEESKKYLSGSYEWIPTAITSNCIFYFSPEGKVIWHADAYSIGTYKVENNQVTLYIDETRGPGYELVEGARKELTLNFIDEKTLSDEHGALFQKISDDNVLIEQQKEYEQIVGE